MKKLSEKETKSRSLYTFSRHSTTAVPQSWLVETGLSTPLCSFSAAVCLHRGARGSFCRAMVEVFPLYRVYSFSDTVQIISRGRDIHRRRTSAPNPSNWQDEMPQTSFVATISSNQIIVDGSKRCKPTAEPVEARHSLLVVP